MIVERNKLWRISQHVSVAHAAMPTQTLTEILNHPTLVQAGNPVVDVFRQQIKAAFDRVHSETASAFEILLSILHATAPGAVEAEHAPDPLPIPMRIHCPICGTQHVDDGVFATKPHKSHTCQNQSCGLTWKVANVPTVGVRFLPGTNGNHLDVTP